MSPTSSSVRAGQALATRQKPQRRQAPCYRATCCAEGGAKTGVAPLLTRRSAASALLLAPLAAALAAPVGAEDPPAAPAAAQPASAGGIAVVEDRPGVGTAAAAPGDLVIVHYVGTLDGTGALFDSTRGGGAYRDGGGGVLRPLAFRLGGDPQPGVCAGLERGIAGMSVGGEREFTVPPELGFGAGAVLGPYGAVPGGSTLRYRVSLLRLSRRGPDALMSGIAQCGAGAVMERTAGCADISVAEFV